SPSPSDESSMARPDLSRPSRLGMSRSSWPGPYGKNSRNTTTPNNVLYGRARTSAASLVAPRKLDGDTAASSTNALQYGSYTVPLETRQNVRTPTSVAYWRT